MRHKKGGVRVKLAELKRIIDFTIEHLQNHQSPEETNVLITLSETSMGARASSEIKYAGMGMDWEHGQFRIEPTKSIVSRGNAFKDIKSVECRPYEGRNFYFCPRCQGKITKDDTFCRYCSQQLK